MSHHCEYGVESPLNYPVSDVKVWGRNITHGLHDQGNIGLIPHFDVETLCKYITIKNYTMETNQTYQNELGSAMLPFVMRELVDTEHKTMVFKYIITL